MGQQHLSLQYDNVEPIVLMSAEKGKAFHLQVESSRGRWKNKKINPKNNECRIHWLD